MAERKDAFDKTGECERISFAGKAMKTARGHISTLVWTAIFLASLSPHAHAQPAPESCPVESTSKEAQKLPKVLFAVSTGVSYLPDLSAIEPHRALINPERFGRFDAWGFNFEVAYHRQLVQWDSADLYIGGDVGLFTHGNTKKFDVRFFPSGETTQGEVFARGFYLTPSAKVVLKRSHSWRPFLGAGAGYYLVDFAELINDPLGGSFEADELFAVSRQRKWDTLGPRVKRELKGLRGWDPIPSKGCS